MMGSKYSYLLFVIWCTLLISNCKVHSHSHSHHDHHHDHDIDEPPSFKYSREANDKTHNAHHVHEEAGTHKESKQVPNNDVWLYAMGSTLLISAAPVVILFVVPLDNTEQKQPLLKILLAFASGGLLGDAFLHLIPHAMMNTDSEHAHGHSHSHGHEHEGEHVHDMSVGLGVLFGILAFLMVEKGVRFIKGGHGHSHIKNEVDDKTAKESEKHENANKDESGDKPNTEKKAQGDDDSESESHPDIKVSGYLNLAADFCHNFTDGLAIGASYLAGNNVGLITTITILLHEVPHEIGDFAILLQSGVSKKNAMLLQLTTAVGALAGTALSLCAQDGFGLLAANWILPFTAGGFIYIALVSVIPELLEEEKPNLIQTILQLLAMLGGVYMMVLIAEFE